MLEDGDAGIGGVVFAGDDHGVFGAGGLLGQVVGLDGGRLGKERRRGKKCGGTEGCGDGTLGAGSDAEQEVFLQGACRDD